MLTSFDVTQAAGDQHTEIDYCLRAEGFKQRTVFGFSFPRVHVPI